MLQALCQKFCLHCRPTPRSHQKRSRLSLGSRVPGHLRPPQDPPHHQPYHRLPGLQPAVLVIYRRLHNRPRHNPRASTGRQRAHYLLCLALPQPVGESLPCNETGVPRHHMGRRQVPPIPDVDVIRGLYGPLRIAVAQDNAHRIHAHHRWSAALEEYDFVLKHRPGKSQTHADELSRLPVDPPPPEDAILQVRLMEDEDEARKIARELHTATHLGGHALWKIFRDRYSHRAGCRICLETAQSCPQCQLGTDYGHRQKTTGTIQSQGPWDTLSINIVGPLPPDHRIEFLIVFVDCFSKYTILIPSSNHTATTVSEALMPHVMPYFGTSRRLLSDRGREFISSIWTKLLRSLGAQQVLTSPYHPKGNVINERSHPTLNNMPHPLAGRTLHQSLGRKSARNHVDPQCHASRASWVLSFNDRNRSRANSSPKPRL